MITKTAITAAPILPILAERWSPRSFDKNHEITEQQLLSILEAARWAPSGSNRQPWRFGVAKRGSTEHAKVVSQLAGFNAAWAPNASAIIVAAVQTKNADGSPIASAQFDLGLAVSQLIIEAHSLGLHAHVIAGFNRDSLKAELQLGDDLSIPVLIVVGKIAPAEQLDAGGYEREIAPRTRESLEQIMLFGKP